MSINLGIFVFRVLFGAAVAAHGSQKLFGAFGGYGLKGTGGFFESLGYKPGVLFAALAGCGEFFGGLLLALGFFTPLGAALVLSAMIVAMASVHIKNGFFATNNGIELPFLYAVAAVAAIFTGGGAYSLDAKLGLGFVSDPYVVGGALVVALIGAVGTLALRHRGQPQMSPQH